MSFTPDWNLICTGIWGLITVHWSIVFAGESKKVNLVGATIPLLVGGLFYFLSSYFVWGMGANFIILCLCLITSLATTLNPDNRDLNAFKSYSNVWKTAEPTIKQDWTMALPVIASILLFWM